MVDDPKDETPTAPEIPHLTCPDCHGTRTLCETCFGEGVVDRHRFALWHAKTQGRPHE